MSIALKTKTNYPVSLGEAKRHLRVEEDWHDDDDYIDQLIKAATQKAEQYIGKDIAETTNVQTLYDFYGDAVKIEECNFLSFTQAVTDTSTLATVDYTEIFYNYANIEFTSTVDSDPLTITYVTGYDETEVPALIKQSVLVKIADLYDVDRQSYLEGNIRSNKAFESLLDSFRYVTF